MSTAELGGLFIGPAVVVDDRVNDPTADVRDILEQFERADVPVLKLPKLPREGEVKHWSGFSMIVLDWELSSRALLEPSADDLDSRPPAGLMMPDDVTEREDGALASFVDSLLSELYCPIFVVSNLGKQEIDRRLRRHLGDDARLASRVLVRGKSELKANLWEDLASWTKSHAAVYALKVWESEYEKAKRLLFSDLEQMSPDWPGILWSTFTLDSVDEGAELAETVSRNILHRMERLSFDSLAITGPLSQPFDRESLHRVLHGQAVVPARQIPSEALMQGDFYFAEPEGTDAPETILINVSAACDLVPRKSLTIDDVRIRLVEAKRANPPTSNSKFDAMRNGDGTTALIHLLTPYGVPYVVTFSTHREMTRSEIPFPRQGRLLPPYLTQLLQAFALYILRPGLPRLPKRFYFDPPEAAAPPGVA